VSGFAPDTSSRPLDASNTMRLILEQSKIGNLEPARAGPPLEYPVNLRPHNYAKPGT
jgi:hypothetical protein